MPLATPLATSATLYPAQMSLSRPHAQVSAQVLLDSMGVMASYPDLPTVVA